MKRLFIALDVAIPVVEQLVVLQRQLDDALVDDDVRVRWTSPENIHVTMKFLGDIEDPLAPMLRDALADLVEPLFAFEVQPSGIGVFPDPETPRILWAGFDQESQEVLSLLQKALERDLEELGIPSDDRPFRPHVTLGRVKSRAEPNFEAILETMSPPSFGKSYIKDIILYESTLTDAGPAYTVLERFVLGG